MSEDNQSPENELGDIQLDWQLPPRLSDLKRDLREATPYHAKQTQKIHEYLDNLHVQGKAKIKAPPGRSSVVPKLIRKQAEWRYSALSEPFLSTDNLFNVKPVTWEDTRAAQQNELLLNHQFNNRLNKNALIDAYVRTAVDEGTVIMRVGWVYEEETYFEEVPTVELEADPSMAETLMQAAQLQATNPNGYETEVPYELKIAVEESIKDQIPYRPIVTGSTQVEKVRVVKNHPTLEVCDYDNVYVDPTCQGDTDKASFLIFSFGSSKAALQKDGRYSNLDKINLTTNTIVGEPDHASHSESFNFEDDARKKFVVYEYWGYWDVDGSGTVTPFVASWVGNTLIRLEENPFPDKKIPFVIVPYLPVRKSVYGEPDGALLEDNQKIIGAVTRGMIDILGRSANGQVGIRKDMLDVTNRRKFERGLDYEFNVNVDPHQGVFMHTFPEIPNSAQFMLQLQNFEAESLTGVKAFSGGLSGDQLGDVATAVRGVLDAASKRELGLLRRLADGLVQVGRKIVAMNAEFLSEEEVVRITNEQFVKIRKDELAGQFDLKLTISTAEEDNAKAQELAFMLQTMGNNVDFGILKQILSKMFTLRKMPDLAKAIESYEPPPNPLQQLEQQKLQLELEELRSRIRVNYANAGLDEAKIQTEIAKAENLGADTDKKALDFIEQESGVTQERELQRQGEQARANMQLEAFKNKLDAEKQLSLEFLKQSGQSGN